MKTNYLSIRYISWWWNRAIFKYAPKLDCTLKEVPCYSISDAIKIKDSFGDVKEAVYVNDKNKKVML